MKRLLLIILLLVLCISVAMTDVVLVKAKFGNWDKWDESLPPWDNEDWVYNEESLKIIGIPPVSGTQFRFWAEGQERWRSIKIGDNSPVASNVLFLLTRLAFKNNKMSASIILFSPAPINKEIKGIEEALATAKIAIAAFHSKEEKKVVIRSYEKKDGLLQFFKEWTVALKNKKAIFPEKYKDWFINLSNQLTKENIEILPKLVVLINSNKKMTFFIGVSLPSFKKFLMGDKVPWIKEETTVVF